MAEFLPDGRGVLFTRIVVPSTGQETPVAGLPPRPFGLPQLSRDGSLLMLSDVGQGEILGSERRVADALPHH